MMRQELMFAKDCWRRETANKSHTCALEASINSCGAHLTYHHYTEHGDEQVRTGDSSLLSTTQVYNLVIYARTSFKFLPGRRKLPATGVH